MPHSLSIRSYTLVQHEHVHDYHQLVLPLCGSIRMVVSEFSGKVGSGSCIIIRAGALHSFSAPETARFVVADLDTLPVHLCSMQTSVFSISQALQTFLPFIDQQLSSHIQSDIEECMLALFYQLLEEQHPSGNIDLRIRKVLDHMQAHIDEALSIDALSIDALSIDALASVACLGATQFKKVFKQQLGVPPMQYMTALKMKKAAALLVHTDTPIHLVADLVGYTDFSAFTRRFRSYHGMSPKHYRS